MNEYLNEKYKETERLLKEYIRLKADAKQARQEEDETSEAAQRKKSAKKVPKPARLWWFRYPLGCNFTKSNTRSTNRPPTAHVFIPK